MAKRKFSYPRVNSPHSVTLGRGCTKTAVDDFEGVRVAVFVSGSPSVRSAAEGAIKEDATQWLVKPAGEPTSAMVAAAATQLCEIRPQVILAIGGGSVLDWARLSWAASVSALDPMSPTARLAPDAPEPPVFVLVPTTCATGAESATVAVMSHETRKFPIVADAFMARHVFLDPQFIESWSQERTALFLCDAASHAIEAFVSIVPNRMGREMAVTGLGLLRRGFVDEPDSGSLEQLMLGSYFAGAAASHCSVGSAHAFAHTAARLGMTHAYGNALALPGTVVRLEAAGKLDDLASGAGFDSGAALVAWVDSLSAIGARAEGSNELARQLATPAELSDFVSEMRADVCMRTSPLRMTAEEAAHFVSEIVAAA